MNRTTLLPDTDKAFVSMPFRDEHSDELWRLTQLVCSMYGLSAVRGDTVGRPGPILEEIVREVQSANVIIADLTGTNANVLYEVGLAHAHHKTTILVARVGEILPFDVVANRCIFFDLSHPETKQQYIIELGRALTPVRAAAAPTLIEGVTERTLSVIADLEGLEQLPSKSLVNQVVWFSGFLSTFAIGDDECFLGSPDYYEALMREKACLLKLAQRGCMIRCIITPPSEHDLIAADVQIAMCRLRTLIDFLERPASDPTIDQIEFAVSPYRQKNLYVIGQRCVSEGFKVALDRGYPLTLRSGNADVVAAHTAAMAIIFQRLVSLTLTTYFSERPTLDIRHALRDSVVSSLQKSLNECRGRINRE